MTWEPVKIADKTGKLSDEAKDAIDRRLERDKPACPVCGQAQWRYDEMLLRIATQDRFTIASSYPVLVLVCLSCGFNAHFAPGLFLKSPAA